MVTVTLLQSHIFQTILANPQLTLPSIFFGIRTKIPSVYFKPSNLYSIYVFHFSNLLMFFLQSSGSRIHFSIPIQKHKFIFLKNKNYTTYVFCTWLISSCRRFWFLVIFLSELSDKRSVITGRSLQALSPGVFPPSVSWNREDMILPRGT